MIYIFRKEMKKWKNVLWLVFASFALGGLSFIFMGKQDPRHIAVAKVDGNDITLSQYRTALGEIKATIDMYKNYAKAYGAPADMFLNMLGLSNPEQAAVDKCIRSKLVGKIQDSLNIELSDEVFDDELAKVIPTFLVDNSGKINMSAYRNYLHSRLGTTVSDYEEEMRQNFAREIVSTVVKNSYYTPLKNVVEEYLQDNVEKSFKYICFSLDGFLVKVKKITTPEKELKSYYQKNKEHYRIGKKIKSDYWTLSVADYEEKVKIDDGAVQNYYDRNKSGLFRISPKVKVRHIFFNLSEDASPDQAEIVNKNAKDVFKKAKDNPNKFSELAKQYSQDEKTKSDGGLIDFFSKGKTYAPEFEKAAFRLKKDNELSGIIKTKNGLEIIKLEKRIPASEKPLKDVYSQIVKTLKTKKALNNLRGDIESLLYKARSNQKEIMQFMDKNKIKKEKTGWLSDSSVEGEKIENLLANKFFSKQGSQKNYGYFINDGLHVVYLLVEKEESYLPKFEKVKDAVTNNFYDESAKKELKKEVRLAKKDLLLGKTTMDKLADKLGLKVKTTGMIKKGADINGISKSSNFSSAIFVLNDKSQVSKQKVEPDYYLTQLIKDQKFDEQGFKKEKDDIMQKVSDDQSAVLFDTFVASLQRNARIEMLDKIGNTSMDTEI